MWSGQTSSGPAGPNDSLRRTRNADSAVAVRVRRGVATLEPDLVRTQPAEVVAMREEPLVDAQPAVLADVQLRHPGADPVGIELVVPGAVQRVGEVHPLAVPADL